MSTPRFVKEVLSRAVAAFVHEYGRRPTWGAFAPGRVNLIGEHTDYNGGFVLPIAIDRVCVAVGAPAADAARSRVHSVDVGANATFDIRQPLCPGASGISAGSWASYVVGVLAGFQELGLSQNLDIAVASSVPLGSGLSSSASLEMATATLAEEVMNLRLGELEKAKLCQRAEHLFAGVPCGIMDPLASASGRSGCALLVDCETESIRPVRLPDGLSIIVVNSNIKHSLAGGEYAKRRSACESAARKLGVPNLRRASLDQLDGRLMDEEARCARHVISECSRTLDAASAFESGRVGQLSDLFAESHASLRDVYRVSCRELDVIVDAAMGQEGVVGARMTGGGFGGCVVVLVTDNAKHGFMDRVTSAYKVECGREATAFAVVASDGARALTDLA